MNPKSHAEGEKPLFAATVHLTFRPEVKLINSTRDAVTAFLDPILSDADATARIAVAAHELLENAFKYSLDGQCSIEISMVEQKDGNGVRVRVSNRCSASSALEARRLVELLRRAHDPTVAYAELLEQSVLREAGSGLGLARIRAECHMDLECDASDDALSISATMRVRRGAR